LSANTLREEQSATSKLGTIFQVPDLSQNEAMKYLKDQNIEDGQAKEIYGFVGGRITMLNKVVNLHNKGQKLSGGRILL
jgi:hypothetical protein